MRHVNSAHKFQFAVIENTVFTSVFIIMLGIWFGFNDGSSIILVMLIIAIVLFASMLATAAYWMWTGKLCTIKIYSDRIEWRRYLKKVVVYADNLAVERVSCGGGGRMPYFMSSAATFTLFNNIKKYRALANVPYFLAFRLRDKLTGESVLIDFTSVHKSIKMSECENAVIAEAARKGIIEYKRCTAQVRYKTSLGISRRFEKDDRFNMKIRFNRFFALYVYIFSAMIAAIVLVALIVALAIGPEWEAFTAIALMGIAYALIIFVLFSTGCIKVISLDDNGILFRKHFRKNEIAYGDITANRVDNTKLFPRFDFVLADKNNPKRKVKIRLTPEKMQAVLNKCEGTQFHDALTAALDEWNECMNGSALCDE